MMAGMPVTAPDGNIQTAADRLHIAVSGFVDEVKAMAGGAVRVVPSWYDQLSDSTATTMGHATVQTARRSMPPVWCDALDLRCEIDAKTLEWEPAQPTAPARLRAVAARPWRPQDTSGVEKIAGNVESWSVSVQSLLHPTSVKQLSAPCPACGAKSAYRRDSAGERVRVPALQIITELGCTCLVCRHTWGPELYLHLARVLGFETPAGVIE
jgi:hypothetical protein